MFCIRLALIAEFEECGLTCKVFVLKLNAHEKDIWWYWLALIALCVNFRLAALLVLKRKATRFL